MAEHRASRVNDRDSEYQRKHRANMMISPERKDAFADDADTSTASRSYADIMREGNLERERETVMRQISEKKAEETEAAKKGGGAKKRRWDVSQDDDTSGGASTVSEWDVGPTPAPQSRWDSTPAPGTAAAAGGDFGATPAPRASRWDATPAPGGGFAGDTPAPGASKWDATPAPSAGIGGGGGAKASRWDATPVNLGPGGGGGGGAAAGGKKSRWDETPLVMGGAGGVDATPLFTTGANADPMATPLNVAATPDQMQALKYEREAEERNRPMTDEELDSLLPTAGFKVMAPPAAYEPIRTPARKLLTTPTPVGGTPGFAILEEDRGQRYDIPPTPDPSLPDIKPEDYQHFSKLLSDVDEEGLSNEEAQERKIMKLLLKVKVCYYI
jgi:splicing factor 3B subunit 1